MPDTVQAFSQETILAEVKRYWGHGSLRDLQEQAIRAGLEQRDSLVVMPTGGGKSLCYQVPPALTGQIWIVVSPLISLMKDQVDGLRACGYPAAALHSMLDSDEQRATELAMLAGELRLVFVAPERLVTPRFLEIARQSKVAAFAIDEAHCISQWGHDFRPEYRRLAEIRKTLPGVAMHAYTATATPRVRVDIAAQLGLENHAELVGTFDRPNLTYRVVARNNLADQVAEVLKRHNAGVQTASGSPEAAIVYCQSRKQCESLARSLQDRGVRAGVYHAGVEANKRKRVQEDFTNERLNVVCATVAFGMGIDRSNVRCVVHASMPASVEAYQQETGRAGRDGLPAECVLLYSPSDSMRWKRFIDQPPRNMDRYAEQEEPLEVDPELVKARSELLRHMQRYASSIDCRHAQLSGYFGQEYTLPEGADNCGACDACLGELTSVDGADDIAKKIISCVLRFGDMRYGVGHLVDVLMGSEKQTVMTRGHHNLSTYGLLKGTPGPTVRSFVYQLIDQGALGRTEGDMPVLFANGSSIEVLKGDRAVRFIEPKRPARTRSKADAASWEGVDEKLFEALRQVRTRLASERQVPPWVIFSDATLRDLARLRPASQGDMLACHGVGNKKAADFADEFLPVIKDHAADPQPAG